MGANGKILYVGETTRPAALDLVLEGQGYQISTARDVNAALGILRMRHFEVLVVEQDLLEVDREKWRQVNRIEPQIPILGVSVR